MNLLNWTFFREVAIPQDIANLLINGEQPVAAFATIRDVAVFTDKRLIVKDAQGLTEIQSLPYSSILLWSTENSGKIFDLNAEVELWTKVGKIKINLRKDIDIRRFDTLLAQYILQSYNLEIKTKNPKSQRFPLTFRILLNITVEVFFRLYTLHQ